MHAYRLGYDSNNYRLGYGLYKLLRKQGERERKRAEKRLKKQERLEKKKAK